MSDDEETGETPDFLTHKELSDYREAFGKLGLALQAHGRAAMEAADALSACAELAKARGSAHKILLKTVERIAKARGKDPEDVADIDRERALIVWKA